MRKLNFLSIIILFIFIAGCTSNKNTSDKAKYGDLAIEIEMDSNEFESNSSDSITITIIIKNIANKTVKISKHYFDEVSVFIEKNNDRYEQPKSSDDYNKDSYVTLKQKEEISKNSSLSINGRFYSYNNDEFIFGLLPGDYSIFAQYFYDNNKIDSNKLYFKIL